MKSAKARAIEVWSRGNLVIQWMKREGLPIDRQSYLYACGINEAEIDAEIEAEIPDFLRQ
jgi:hypothetical protein